jgi:hypothetical protein
MPKSTRLHGQHQNAAAAAEAALTAALADRQSLLDRAATGENVTTQDLRSHEDGLRNLEADVLLRRAALVQFEWFLHESEDTTQTETE